MSFWTAVRTLHRHEALAVGQLALSGFETFFPKMKANGRVSPLFSNYLFVAIGDCGEGWTKVNWTPGVLRLITFGARPARVPDHEIARLKARLDEDGIVRLPPPPKFVAGDPVVVTDGAFRGLAGIHTGMTAHQREIVLLEVLGAPRRVTVEAGMLAAR